MKFIGAIILITATSYMGIEYSRKMEERPRQIRILKNALQIMHAEIIYSHSSIPLTCFAISKQISQPLSLFFYNVGQDLEHPTESLYKVWKDNLEKLWDSFSLINNDKEILLQFGRSLGKHDVMQQEKHIKLCLSHLERQLEEALDQRNRYAKMFKSLGVLCLSIIARGE